MKVKNKETDKVILNKLEIADTFYKRFKGLMGRKYLEEGNAMIVSPCNSIHCFFMKIPIDVLFVSRDHVVVKIISDMKPWRISPIVRKAMYVIEANSNEFRGKVEVGDQLEYLD